MISISIMVFRVSYFVLVMVYLKDWEHHQTRCPYRSLNNVDKFSVYCDLVLGIQTMSMMIDLALNVKTTVAKEYADR